jgi:hypothetical protein
MTNMRNALFTIYGLVLAGMVYVLFFTDASDIKNDKSFAVKMTEKEIIEENNAILDTKLGEEILITGKIINKSGRWEEEDNAGWYHVIYQGKIHACEVYTEEQPVTSKVLRIFCMDVNGRVESRP